MSTIGVTIGIGKKYYDLAEKAATAFAISTGFDYHIIDQSDFENYNFNHLTDKLNEQTWLMKLYMFDLFPDAENIIYFDADWIALYEMNFKPYLYQKSITVVRDRVYENYVNYATKLLNIGEYDYFNTGFFIVNRTNHKRLLEHAREIYQTTKKSWGEQCALNKAVHDLQIPIKYLSKEYNFMDYEPNTWVSQNLHINAIHNQSNKEIQPIGKLKSDKSMMDKMSYSHKITVDEIDHDLFSDGFTTGRYFWICIGNNDVYFYDKAGNLINDVILKTK